MIFSLKKNVAVHNVIAIMKNAESGVTVQSWVNWQLTAGAEQGVHGLVERTGLLTGMAM